MASMQDIIDFENDKLPEKAIINLFQEIINLDINFEKNPKNKMYISKLKELLEKGLITK